MKVLLCINSTQKCGVAGFGRLHYEALIKAKADVTLWHADYPIYLPEDAEEYDIVHINSHPLVLNHIRPQHLPKKPLVSYLFHEVPNHWWEADDFPDVWHRADVRLTEEAIPGWEGDGKTYYWQMPIPDYTPTSEPPKPISLLGPWVVGRTGILPDGLDWLEPVAHKNCWKLSKSGEAGWLPLEAEIERLAKCHVIDCSRHSTYSGQASSVLTAIASRRPVLVNSARLLTQIRHRDAEVANELYFNDSVEDGVKQILADILTGTEKRPHKLAERYSWSNQTQVLLALWQSKLDERNGKLT